MRVGIVTFHFPRNFGAVIQCCALQRALTRLGHEVDVIDYTPPGYLDGPWWRGWNVTSGRLRETLPLRRLQIQHKRSAIRAFDAFRHRHLTLSEGCSTLDGFRRVAGQYDAVVSGSDQVWVFDVPSAYFLDLGNAYVGRRISYAACCGHDRQRTDRDAEITGLLGAFDAISVRDDFSKRIISARTEKPVHVVCDPTLLGCLDGVAQDYAIPHEEYILLYALSQGEAEEQERILDAIRGRVGDLPVVCVVANSRPRKSPHAQLHVFDADPGQWLGLISGAKFVYTDSYHCVLFCVQHGVPFVADYKEPWRSLRLLDVALRYNLDEYIVASVDRAVQSVRTGTYDFTSSLDRVAAHRGDSMQFLSDAVAE